MEKYFNNVSVVFSIVGGGFGRVDVNDNGSVVARITRTRENHASSTPSQH